MILISKVYKVKDKLAVYLPFDFVKGLDVKEGDEIDFLPYQDREYIVAKKSDIAAILANRQLPPTRSAYAAQPRPSHSLSIEPQELAVLKKLDAIRYNDRIKDRIKQALSGDEKRIMTMLIKKQFVTPFKKPGEKAFKYGISRNVYDEFLFGKRERTGQVQRSAPVQSAAPQPQPKRWEEKLSENKGYLNVLETSGFIVVSNQAEASAISTELESSIRNGLVLGTRAFNKKYYVVLKSFINKNAQKIMKALGSKPTNVSEVAKATGIDEEGIRAILYILAEQGEVTETRRDSFRLVE